MEVEKITEEFGGNRTKDPLKKREKRNRGRKRMGEA